MNLTRNGKIARLPKAIRNELNRRLDNGEQGKRLVEWLNGLPEVRAVLAAEFDGKPIREQSLSEWRKGGYRDWVTQQEALVLAERLGEDAATLQIEGRPALTDTLALWLAARYAVATRQVAQAEGPEGWRALRELCADVVELRRGDHSAQRLRLDREELELARQREHEKTEAELWKWAMQPENRERLCHRFKTSAEKIALRHSAAKPQFKGARTSCPLWIRDGFKVSIQFKAIEQFHVQTGQDVRAPSPKILAAGEDSDALQGRGMFGDGEALDQRGVAAGALTKDLGTHGHPGECQQAPPSPGSTPSDQGESSPIKPDQALSAMG